MGGDNLLHSWEAFNYTAFALFFLFILLSFSPFHLYQSEPPTSVNGDVSRRARWPPIMSAAKVVQFTNGWIEVGPTNRRLWAGEPIPDGKSAVLRERVSWFALRICDIFSTEKFYSSNFLVRYILLFSWLNNHSCKFVCILRGEFYDFVLFTFFEVLNKPESSERAQFL